VVIQLESNLKDRLKSQDPTVMRRVLEEIDRQVIKNLKETKDDVRYVQGYSAAIDYLRDLIKQQ